MRRFVAAGAALAALTALAAASLGAQRVGAPAPGEGVDAVHNVPYDGRFTFARIRFDPMGGESDFFGRRDLKWDHDFPRAERNFMRILRELSTVRPYMDGGNVLELDDPELFKYPLVYMCEPGFWAPTDAEAAALRAYLQKGGFIIFDDFFAGHWYNFEAQMRKVLPQARLVPLDPSHPIFDSFFHIESLDFGEERRGVPVYYGIFEDNDPAKRLIAIANYNNDIGEYWEWSDAGYLPIRPTNEAYQLGVNYVVYGMTH
jgi:hypothetical protein